MTTTNHEHRKVIANRIANAARTAGLTNAQLGALVQLGESGVSRRLAGETGWTAEDLATIAPYLGLPVPWWLATDRSVNLKRQEPHPGHGQCASCGLTRSLDKYGLMSRHNEEIDGETVDCDGSSRPPHVENGETTS